MLLIRQMEVSGEDSQVHGFETIYGDGDRTKEGLEAENVTSGDGSGMLRSNFDTISERCEDESLAFP